MYKKKLGDEYVIHGPFNPSLDPTKSVPLNPGEWLLKSENVANNQRPRFWSQI
jgi:hypothetical protein